tara:strand:+ start:2039 stop:2863 length:825 start_codon:yes stop_codon:yes gene_type:complete
MRAFLVYFHHTSTWFKKKAKELIKMTSIHFNHKRRLSGNKLTTLEYIFYLTCKSGTIAQAKYLLSIHPNINISVNQEWIFRGICAENRLHVAKWMFHINPDINPRATTRPPFVLACESGNLELAQWLYKINGAIKVPVSFELACYHNRIDVVLWLLNQKNNAIKINKLEHLVCELQYSNKNMANILLGEIEYRDMITSFALAKKNKKKCPKIKKKIRVETLDICCICQESTSQVITNCKHQFCTHCIQTWTEKNNQCPCCRKVVSSLNLVSVVH